MTTKERYLSISKFAAKHSLGRQTVSDVIDINKLPFEPIGKSKGLSPATQRRVLKILGVKASRPVTAA